jgi:DNA-binding transcriptional ArsR family regulator
MAERTEIEERDRRIKELTDELERERNLVRDMRQHVERTIGLTQRWADRSRLRLLARLGESEVCVSELAKLEHEKLSTVSARLQMLHSVRLVKRRREAKHIFYALCRRGQPCPSISAKCTRARRRKKMRPNLPIPSEQ